MLSSPKALLKPAWVRYAVAILAVAAGYLLRRVLTAYVGEELPTYITFYPAVVVAALLAGLGPGLLATALTVAVVDYWVSSPREIFFHGSAAEAAGVVLFSLMGVFLNVVIELYHRTRIKAADYEKELALRKSQEDLQRQREWLRVTLSSIGDAVLATDTAGRITLFNPTAEKLTGWPEREALSRPVGEVLRLTHEQTRAPAEDIVHRVLRERCLSAPAGDVTLTHRDGREIAVELSAAPIKEAADTVCGVVVVFQDVTGKRQAQRVVLEERDFISTVLDTAGALVIVLDLEGRIQRFNRACEVVSGYRFEEVKGRPFWDFLLAPEEVAPVRVVFSQLQAGQFPNRHENDWIGKGGERRRISWSNTCVQDHDGRVQFIVGTGIDLTQQRAAEDEFRKMAEQHQLALEAGNLGTWNYNLVAGEVVWDERCRSLFGLSKGDRIDYQKVIDLIHAADRAGVDQAVQAALAPDSTGAYEREYRVVWPDGTEHWLAAKGQAYFQGEGSRRKPVRFVGTIRDITERRQTEATLAFLAQCGAPPARDFFKQLARFLADTLQQNYVCIDRLDGDAATARTIAVFHDGKFEDNVSYTLKDTPCGEAVGKTVCCFPAGVRQRFPRDTVLQNLEAESYVGTTLWSHSCQPIGLIAVIGRRPLGNPRLAESLLQLVASRAGGELERQQAEQALLENQQRLLLAQQAGHLGTFDLNLQARHCFWSDERKALFGLPPGFQPTFDSWDACVNPADLPALQADLQRAFKARRREIDQVYRITRPDQQERWLEDRALITYDASGQPIRMVGTTTDITADVRAKERAHQRQRQFQFSALRAVAILTVSLFVAEAAIMAALAGLPAIGPWWGMLLDRYFVGHPGFASLILLCLPAPGCHPPPA